MSPMKKDCIIPLVWVFDVLLLVYWVGYFASVTDQHYFRFVTLNHWNALPYYRGIPPCLQGVADRVFAPAYFVDSRVLRPSIWAGRNAPYNGASGGQTR